MESTMTVLKNVKGGKVLKKFNNNKGFSLVELLIVIAIMGVLAVIALNMFNGVLGSSKKKADLQQAKNIEKAIVTYCVDSSDWDLSGTGIVKTSTEALITSMMSDITFNGDTYKAPFTAAANPASPADAANLKPYKPQWTSSVGGTNVGYDITIYTSKQTVIVKPGTTAGGTVTINTAP